MTSISNDHDTLADPDPRTPLLTLDDIRAVEPTTAGAKGAGLAALRQAGFEVPDARILAVGIEHQWPSGPAPASVRAAVENACRLLGNRLAVRTSATWEDGASKSHAGATTTVLDVGGVDNVLTAIRRCLDESTAAAARSGVEGALAVILQRLVPADWAGVAFSADPLTGDRDIVRIAATAGLGEALVQGDVIGDDITVRGDVVESGASLLPTEDVLAIAETARNVEAALGQPHDIEWAIAGGRLHLLQARPITVLPIEPTYPEGNNWQKDVAHYPEPMTPFGWSLMQYGFQDVPSVFDAMGLLVRGLEEVSVGGEIYGRVLPAFGSANAAGSPPPAAVLGVVSRLAPPIRRRTALAKAALEGEQAQRWLDEWFDHGRDAAESRNRTLGATKLAELADDELSRHLDALLGNVRTGMREHFELMMPLAHALFDLHQFAGQHLEWDDATMMSMLAGASPATRAPHEALESVRKQLASQPGAADAIRAQPHDPIGALQQFDRQLAGDLTGWMEHHGWAMINYDAGVPVLAERPETISQLILHETDVDDVDRAGQLIAEARTVLATEHVGEFDRLLAAVQVVYPVREDNTIILGERPMALVRQWMLETARRLVARGELSSVEDGAYLTIEQLRSAIERPGHRSLDEIVAHRRGEEAWVRANPGPLYLGKQSEPPDTSYLPKPLRAVNEPILWMIGHEYPTPAEVADDRDVLVAGVAASAGTAEGVVRVVRSHDELGRLEPGDVLVCQVTSPAWAPLFPLAAAIVADGGGVLSHAAIAAREHGIPAVLGTSSGTTSLVDGQRVLVDGTRGLVLAAT